MSKRYVIQVSFFDRGYTYYANDEDEARDTMERLQREPGVEQIELFEQVSRRIESWARTKE